MRIVKSGVNLHSAFVEFEEFAPARFVFFFICIFLILFFSTAMQSLNGRLVLNSKIEISFAPVAGGSTASKEDVSKHANVFVGNLPNEINEHALLELFSPYKPSTSRLIREAGTDQFKGYGFVTFVNPADAQV